MRGIAFGLSLACGVVLALLPPADAGAVGDSPISAGYIASFSTQSTTFSATFTVPKAKCLNSQGLDGYLSTEVFLTGPSGGGGALVSTTCPDGAPVYSAELVTSTGATVSEAVAPGDTLAFKGSANPSAESYHLDDPGRGHIKIAGSGFAVDGVQATEEAQAGPFPKYKKIEFSALVVNAQPFGALNPTAYDQTDGSVIEQQVSALKHEIAFSVKYLSQG
jgi:hypothetical protein